MNVGQELSELISRFESFSLLVLERQQQHPEIQNQSAVYFNEKQNIEALIYKSIPILRQLKHLQEEILQFRSKYSKLQQTNENASLEINYLKQNLRHSKQSIIELSQQEQQLKLQNQHLQSMIINVQAQYEIKYAEKSKDLKILEEDNVKLRNHIKELNLKIIELQKRNREISEICQELKRQLQHYIHVESTLEKTLIDVKESYEGLTYTLREEIQQKEIKIQQLEESKASNLKDESPEDVIYQQFGWGDHNYYECFDDPPTEEKLVKLSEEVTLQQNKLILLESVDSIQGSNREFEKVQLFRILDETNRNMLRKVTSSIDLYRRRSQLSKQLDMPIHLQLPTRNTLGQLQSSDNLNNMQDISQINRVQKIQIHTETQVTEGEQILPIQQKTSVSEMDPYYIHYLLIVQNVKIEEDQEGIYGILEIDMKPYFWELKALGLGISKWPEWVRQKLLTIHQKSS